MTDTVEVPEEAVRLAGEAAEDAAMRWLGRDLGTLHRDDIARDALAAAVPLLRAQWEREQRIRQSPFRCATPEDCAAGAPCMTALGCGNDPRLPTAHGDAS